MRVTIVDYKVGNISSIINMLSQFNKVEVTLSRDPNKIIKSDKVILPGVGAFGNAMLKINDYGLIDPINEFVKTGNSLLGICLGMQLLMDSSDELGINYGLGLIPGLVKEIPRQSNTILPNIGYYKINFIDKTKQNNFQNYWYYFVHSYHCIPKFRNHIESEIYFNKSKIVASVSKENIKGCQFHPEKSSKAGFNFFKKFIYE